MCKLRKVIPEGMEQCDECDGTGEACYSCCTGDVITGDYLICPTCKEWLGEEECVLCEGKGYVEPGTLTAGKIDLQLLADRNAD